VLSKLEQGQAEQCRRSFFRFFCYFWSEIEASDLTLSWHIKFLCNFLQGVAERWERKEKQDDVLINIAFGLSKSTILQLFEAWVIERNPQVKILGTSYAGKISTKNAGKVRECLKSPKFQRFFPRKVQFNPEIDGKTQFGTRAKGIYYTSSTGAAATGMHSDFILNDDPLSAQEANSKVKRDKAKDFLSETLSSRKTTEHTVTITVMQRLHLDDPSGYLLEKKLLQHVCLPVLVDASNRHLVQPKEALAYYDQHNGYLSPTRFGDAKIASFKVDLGPYAFAAQVQQNPLDDSTGIFKKGNFEIITWEQFNVVTAGKTVTWDFDADTALTDDRANDPTALLASYTVDGTTYIRESFTDYLAYEKLLDSIPTFLDRNGRTTSSTLYVEPKANGKSVIDSLTKRGKVLLKEAPAPTRDKVQRAHDILAYVYQNNVKLIDGAWVVPFLQELTTFPNAPHDDRVDTLTQCLARVLGIGQKKKKVMRVYGN
jgi:predicted phage terminase large subunit-like protein